MGQNSKIKMLLSFKQDLPEQKSKLEDFQNIAKRIVQADLLLNKISSKEKECVSLETGLKNKQK